VTGSHLAQPLPTLVELLRSGRVASTDLVEECLARIRADQRVNAVVELDAGAAR
jgi:Asp-tRNA(Asn)/Glu-tRNA(Gln) amidotransferase A subunit family amidase